MTAELSFGFPGNAYPCNLQRQLLTPSFMTSHQPRPLRHSIDAILHKTASASPVYQDKQSPKLVLPPIETLRRSDVGALSASFPTMTSQLCLDEAPRYFGRFEDSEVTREDPVSQSSFDSSEGKGEEVGEEDGGEGEEGVVDEADGFICVDDEESLEQNSDKNVPSSMSPDSTKQSSKIQISSERSSPEKPWAFPPNAQRMILNVDPTGTALAADLVKEKSAFKPIVRPWLAGEKPRSPRTDERSPEGPVGAAKERLRSLATSLQGLQGKCAARSALRSLDAISLLRRQSSAFRVAGCRQADARTTHAMATVSSSNLSSSSSSSLSSAPSSGLSVSQPLPSSLASWFSWLRAGGGLHFGTPHHQPPHPHHHPHAAPQPFGPRAPPCPGRVLSAASATPHGPVNPATPHQPHHHHQHHHQQPPPQQAPRYNCEACGKSYSTFGGLSKHKQFHCAAQVKKDFRCKFCDKSYSSLGALKMHIRTHTLPCKCQVCGKAFSRPWLLQGHVRTHTGEKPFSCPHCARAFADRSNLRAHLQTHSDVKKYSCRHCSKTFSRMSLLVKHRDSSCLALHR